jgi:hypothetical protein
VILEIMSGVACGTVVFSAPRMLFSFLCGQLKWTPLVTEEDVAGK